MIVFSQVDWVGVWKVCSIVSTGAFGVLGLITEYKDPVTKQLTRSGKLSLAGILVSTLLGAAAQTVEASSDAAASKRRDEVLSRQLTTTQQAVREVHRLITPIGNLRFKFVFHHVSCSAINLRNACAKALETRNERDMATRRQDGQPKPMLGFPVAERQDAVIAVVMNEKSPVDQRFNDSDLHIVRVLSDCGSGALVDKKCDPRYGSMRIFTRDGKFVDIEAQTDLEPTTHRKPGHLISFDDLAGGTLGVSLVFNGWTSDKPPFLQIRSPGAVCRRLDASDFKPVIDGSLVHYWVRFPSEGIVTTACN